MWGAQRDDRVPGTWGKLTDCGVNKGPRKWNGLGEGVISERTRDQNVGSKLDLEPGGQENEW